LIQCRYGGTESRVTDNGGEKVNISALTGIVTMVFGLIYTWMAYSMPRASIGKPMDHIIFPLILGIGMIFCGLLLFFVEGRKVMEGGEKREAGAGLARDTKLIIFTCVMAVLYGIFFERLGYVLSTTIFIGSLLFVLNGKKKWKTNVIVAVLFSLIVYIGFSRLLSIPLPMMPILQI
jgi:putative tricarboxylic transport membrane protein